MTLITIDTEFNGFGGEILSLGMYAGPNHSPLYMNFNFDGIMDEWVYQNVKPNLGTIPDFIKKDKNFKWYVRCHPYHSSSASIIHQWLNDVTDGFKVKPVIWADWPDDIMYFCKLIMTAPGTMVSIPYIQFELIRVQSWPNSIEGLTQHNALSDAIALYHRITI